MSRSKLPFFLWLCFSWAINSPACNDSGNPIEGNPPIGDQPVYPAIDAFPAWSPDGKWILYNYYGIQRIDIGGSYHIDPDSAGLWLINADGTNPRLILKGDDINARWSPDGTWIVFESGAQIYKMPILGNSVDTSKIVQLTLEGRNFFPAWSPNGLWIVHDRTYAYPESSSVQGIWLLSVSGSDRHKISSGRFPDWSPDGEHIIFADWFDSQRGGIILFILQTQVRTLRLDAQNKDVRYPHYSRDGTNIAYESNANIWIINADGLNPRQLTTNGGMQPSWSPDGSSIAYVGWTDKKYDPKNNGSLWVMNADGSNKHQLTYGP